MKRTQINCLTLVVIVASFSTHAARADEIVAYEEIVAGFAPHVRSASGGNIDWTAGCILAKGHGFAESTDNQQQLLARRAAVVDAAANALAIAAGIDVDTHGRAGGMRNGMRRLEGQIKGQQIVDETWTPQLDPPRYDVTMRVPLWGVKSVATLFRTECVSRMTKVESNRLPLVLSEADVSGSVLVIDARGTGLNPCLFPVVATEQGATLYNVNAMTANPAIRPPVRYVESDRSFESIQAAIERDNDRPNSDAAPIARLAAARPNNEPAPSKAKAADAEENKDSNKQNEPRKKRRRRRRAVKAVKSDGKNNTKIVLTAEDAEKLRKDEEGANLLRNAEIVVVVDSAAAGIQGRIDGPPADTWLALANSR